MFFLFSVSAFGGELPVKISADRVEGNVQKLVNAEGHVVVTYSDVTIKGDRASYDRERGLLRVWGHVLIREGDVELHCKNLVYDLRTKRAVLEEVYGKISPTDRIRAERIERISEKEWIAYDGEYTPCSHRCPDWSVTSKKFKVLVGESFSGKWVAFRVKEIPIIVYPYLSGPIKRKRESGLLTPRIGYIEKDGFVYKQPFYLVLGRSADLTLFYEKRSIDGEGVGGELRYVLGKRNSGDLNYYQINKKMERSWKLTFSHNYNPSDYLYLKTDFDVVSSRRFYTDTTTFNVEEQTQLYTKSSITGSKLWERAIVNVNALYLRYLNGSTDKAYQRIPNVNFYLMDSKLFNLPVTFNLYSDVTYFYRRAGGSMYRINAEPSLRYVRKIGSFKNSSKLSYLITSYQRGGSRELLQFKDEVKTNKFVYLRGLGFSVNPELSFFYRESRDQSSNPFFDSSDRLKGERRITPAVETFVYSKGKQLMRFSVSSDYDLSEGWRKLSWDFDLFPFEWLDLRESGKYDLSTGEMAFLNSYVSARAPLGIRVWSNLYRQQVPEGITYLRWGTSVPLGRYLSFSFWDRYDVKLSEDRERQYALRINRGCWNGLLSYRWLKTYEGEIRYQITLRVNLLRLGSYGYQLLGRKR